MRFVLFAAAIAGLLEAGLARAGEMLSVELAPLVHFEAQLVVVSPDGRETVYTPAELERFATYRLATTTPWRDAPATFDGVLLTDILDASGLSAAASILVTAENDFTTEISQEVWEDMDILVATRVDGAPHTRRARGPIQFVIDAETYENSVLSDESVLVWMVARIEAGR